MIRTATAFTLTVLCTACTAAPDDEPCAPASEACVLEHETPPHTMPAGSERVDLCASWTLGNETELWVNRVDSSNSGLVHHSNWFHVPDYRYDVPDGLWRCSDHRFSELAAAIEGGVVFAQSTQALSETQQFGDGVAVRIPPYARIVANVHLLNATDAEATTRIRLQLSTIPGEEVTTRLVPFELLYHDLAIPPQSRSAFRIDCDLDEAYRTRTGSGFDATIHYVLPHYHELGDMFDLTVLGGARDGESLYDSVGDTYGEPVGRAFDPPIDLAADGARGLSFTCGFDNPRAETVGWGVGDQEMCLLFGFMESSLQFRGTANDTEQVVEDGARPEHVGGCDLIMQPVEP